MSRQYHLKQENLREPYASLMENIHDDNPFMLPLISDSEILSNTEFNYQLYLHIVLVSQRKQGEEFRRINIYRLLEYLCNGKLISREKLARERIQALIDNSKGVMYREGDDIIINHTKVLYVRIPSEEGKILMWEHNSTIKMLIVFFLNVVRFDNKIMDRRYLGERIGMNSLNKVGEHIKQIEDLGYIHIARIYNREEKKTINVYSWRNDGWR